MQFQTAEFLLTFAVVLVVYFLMRNRYQWLWLLLVSYIFYLSWNISYIPFLIMTTLITWGIALCMEKCRQVNVKKLLVISGCIYSISYLGIFKYTNFLLSNVSAIFDIQVLKLDLLLPIGISFYTFQTLGYLIDVYRGDVKAEKNVFRYALFVSYFPQIVSGPIGRAKDLCKQLKTIHTFDYDKFLKGSVTFLIGMFMKLVIADRAAIFVNEVYAHYEIYGGSILLLSSLLYTMQIYCDFAGYSYMALGVSRMMGIEIIHNFERPYFSASIKEFWRRWHISLSSWLKDYLYIPLGGSRKGSIRTNINLMIVFFISGLWHGANWTFLIWGGIHGLYQIIGKFSEKTREKIYGLLHIDLNSQFRKNISIITTFFLVNFAWIFFRAENISMAVGIIKKIIFCWEPWSLLDGTVFNFGLSAKDMFILLLAIIVIYLMEKMSNISTISEKIVTSHIVIRWAVLYFFIISILVFGIYGEGYSAANFIYSQF